MDPVIEVADGVVHARGTDVNFYLLVEGTDVTLVDSGWTGDVPRVLAALQAVGRRPEDVRAVLLTHAHIDHVGAANHLHDRYRVPVYTDGTEVGHARREYREQAGPAAVARAVLRPGVLPWAWRVARVGGLRDVTVGHARRFPTEGPLDLPGRPVPVPTPGHTSGHTAFHLPAAGAVVTGDGLVTAHPTTGVHGPHTLGGLFDHDPAGALAALDALEPLDADLVLPGHGPVLRRPIGAAVTDARTHAATRPR